VKEISLSSNNIGDTGISDALDTIVNTNMPLEMLNLSQNQISERGAKAIATLLGDKKVDLGYAARFLIFKGKYQIP
jgi:hypothetical protein